MFSCLVIATQSLAQNPIHVRIDGAKRYQTMDGFGTCLAWWQDKPYDEEAFRDLYWRDMGCSILRIEFHPNVLAPTGKLDGPAVRLGAEIEQNIKLMNFRAKGVRNFGEFAAAGKAKKLDEIKLIGSLWTPPHWMKRDAKIGERGESCGGHLKLDSDNLEQFGRYVSAFCKGFERAYGVPVYAISLQNELRFAEPYNSCQYTPEEYVAAVKAVGAELERQKLATKIIGPEDVGVGPPGNDFFLNAEMSFIDAVTADPLAKRYLAIYAIHGYQGDGATPEGSSRENWAKYWARIAADAKPSWQTETSGQKRAWLHVNDKGLADGALTLGTVIQEALVYGNCSLWCYWQMSGGAGNEALLDGMDMKDKKYCVAKHYFRYIRPGAVRVDAEAKVADVCAFVHEHDRTLTIVIVNPAESALFLALHLSAVPNVRTLSLYRTTADESFARQPDIEINEDGNGQFTVAGQSITTLTGTGAAASR